MSNPHIPGYNQSEKEELTADDFHYLLSLVKKDIRSKCANIGEIVIKHQSGRLNAAQENEIYGIRNRLDKCREVEQTLIVILREKTGKKFYKEGEHIPDEEVERQLKEMGL